VQVLISEQVWQLDGHGSQSPTECTICMADYDLVDGQCQQCPSYCYECSNSTTCTHCWQNYGITSTGTCIPCQDPNCLICDATGTICYDCNANFFVENSDGACHPCSTGCDECNTGDTCITCSTGFTLAADGTCTPPPCLDTDMKTLVKTSKNQHTHHQHTKRNSAVHLSMNN